MSALVRDLRVWFERAGECRNPLLWASALKYDLQRRRLLGLVSPMPAATVAAYLREIEDDGQFVAELRARMSQWTSYTPRAIDFMMSGHSGSVFFNEVTLYAVVRAIKPRVMIETGGTPGKSTAFILRAMERNGSGHLYTIDLPPATADKTFLVGHGSWHQSLPRGASSGWVVPSHLKSRGTTMLGKSSEHLPALLQRLERLDIFFHDSDHSYENMMWEFETAWENLKPNGVLLSDDVQANTAFSDFCTRHGLRQAHVFNFGAARR